MAKPLNKKENFVSEIPKKPRLLYLLLCDAVTTDRQGKKSLIGTFDRIFSNKFPCSFGRFSIVTGWEGIEGDYTTKVEIEAPNQKSIFTSPPLGLRFGRPLYRSDAIVEIEGLKFNDPGIYWVWVLLGEKRRLSYPLFLEETSEVKAEEQKT